MSDLPHEFLLPLIAMLNNPSPSDWRDLAKRFGILESEIEGMDREGGRCSALVKKLIARDVTMQELAVQLMDMGRRDIMALLEKSGYQLSVGGDKRIPGSPSVTRKHPAGLTSTSIPENAVLRSQHAYVSSPLLRRRRVMPGVELPKLNQLQLRNTSSEQVQQQDSSHKNSDSTSPKLRFPRRVASEPLLASSLSPSAVDHRSHILRADVQKLALVIGNSQYQIPGWECNTSISEAQAFASQLKKMKWTVTEIENVSLGQLRRSILAFSDRCQREFPVFSVVFYAGHIVTANGVSCMVPVDLPVVPSSAYICHCLVPLQQLLELLSSCAVTVAVFSCGVSEAVPFGCDGVTVLNNVKVPRLNSQTCVIVSSHSWQSGLNLFMEKWVSHWKSHQDASLSSLLNHVAGNGDHEENAFTHVCHCYCKSLMEVTFYNIYPDPKPLTSETTTLKRALVVSPEADTDDLLDFLTKEQWEAQSCTTGSEAITTLHAFLFNKDVRSAQRTVSLVILMGHLAVVDHKPILFVTPSSSPSSLRSAISGELPTTALPLSMVADLIAEAVNGPKVLVVNNCSLSVEADERLCSQIVSPRVNMVVSFSRSQNKCFTSRLRSAWKSSHSLLDVFQEVAPDTTTSCLFTV